MLGCKLHLLTFKQCPGLCWDSRKYQCESSTKLQCFHTFSISQLDSFCPGRKFPFIFGDKVTQLWQQSQVKRQCDVKIGTGLWVAHCSSQMVFVGLSLSTVNTWVWTRCCPGRLCSTRRSASGSVSLGATSTSSVTVSALPSLELLIVASSELAGPCGYVAAWIRDKDFSSPGFDSTTAMPRIPQSLSLDLFFGFLS